jgi:hypothetical protein
MSPETPTPEKVDWIVQWLDAVPAVALACMGGVVRALVARRKKTCRPIVIVMDLAVSAVVAAFAGAVTYFFLDSADISQGVKAGLCGMAGYSGTELLRVFSRRMLVAAGDCDV